MSKRALVSVAEAQEILLSPTNRKVKLDEKNTEPVPIRHHQALSVWLGLIKLSKQVTPRSIVISSYWNLAVVDPIHLWMGG